MFERILIALEERADAPATTALAARLVAGHETTALVVHVRRLGVQVRGGLYDLETRGEAEELVESAVELARRRGLKATGEVITIDERRPVGPALIERATEWKAAAIVMGSHRRSDLSAAMRGSVSHEVIRLATCPVAIAPREPRATRPLRRILLAVDASTPAAAAEAAVARLAREARAEVTVLHVERPFVFTGGVAEWMAPAPQGDEITAAAVRRLREAGVQARPAADSWLGPIATAIVRTARELGADLIVVGSRGLGDVEAVFRGSVSHEVLHQTEMPVLVARPRG